MRLLKTADAPRLGAGERAAFVAEQFAFQQRIRDGGAIDGDERFVGAEAVLINRAGNQFLAGPGGAANQDRGGCGRDPSDFLVDGLHRPAFADDGRLVRPGLAHFHRFGHEPAAGDGGSDQIQQFIRFKRFEQIIARPEFGGFDGRLGCAVRGHQDDRLLRLCGVELGDQIQPAQTGQAQVGDDDIVLVLTRQFQTGVPATGGFHFVTLGAQHLFQGGGACWRHLQSAEFLGSCSSACGRTMAKVVPRLSWVW